MFIVCAFHDQPALVLYLCKVEPGSKGFLQKAQILLRIQRIASRQCELHQAGFRHLLRGLLHGIQHLADRCEVGDVHRHLPECPGRKGYEFRFHPVTVHIQKDKALFSALIESPSLQASAVAKRSPVIQRPPLKAVQMSQRKIVNATVFQQRDGDLFLARLGGHLTMEHDNVGILPPQLQAVIHGKAVAAIHLQPRHRHIPIVEIRPRRAKGFEILRQRLPGKRVPVFIVISPQIKETHILRASDLIHDITHRPGGHPPRIKQVAGNQHRRHTVFRGVTNHTGKGIANLHTPLPGFLRRKIAFHSGIQMNIRAVDQLHPNPSFCILISGKIIPYFVPCFKPPQEIRRGSGVYGRRPL